MAQSNPYSAHYKYAGPSSQVHLAMMDSYQWRFFLCLPGEELHMAQLPCRVGQRSDMAVLVPLGLKAGPYGLRARVMGWAATSRQPAFQNDNV